jgi:tetratricopeptide (TPR) repeat protein
MMAATPVDPRLNGLAPSAIAHVERAKNFLQQREVIAAERELRYALSAAPNHAEVLRLLGMSLRLQERNDDALQVMRRAVAQKPADALTQNGLGTALDACGDRDAAIVAFRRACELAPQSAQLWSNFGKTLSDHGLFDEAVPVLERAVARGALDSAALRLAYALRVLGRTDQSAKIYRGLIANNPNDGQAWLGLSNLNTRLFSTDDVAALETMWQRNENTIDDRISIGFSLARALDDHARYAESMSVLNEANALTHAIRPWSATNFSQHIDAVLSAFDVMPQGADDNQGSNVVFIVGMPRSGSSLTEQILASHPQVEGAGELMELPAVLQEESRQRNVAFPHWATTTTVADWQRMGRDYLHRTKRWSLRGRLFTDKLPDNWMHIGAVMAMLPGARVIDCRRDAVETCFSCYRTLFNEGTQAFTYDIADLAAFYCDYARTTDHWRKLFGARFRRQRYEALVANPETQIRELLDFCGLPYDAACERYFDTNRSVRTASASQVREPLMRDTARAPKYGRLLDPLRDALKSAS